MCGIAGFVQRGCTPQDRSVLLAMSAGIAHRGPDGQGEWLSQREDDWRIALAHRRLAIIDVEGGAQPMALDGRGPMIVFNGEIFNFRELKGALERQGHAFRTRSDTEVILRCFAERGSASFADLNGMFAFALWNQEGDELILARDRTGIKPLYYAELPDGGLAFASELLALTAHPQVPRQIDPIGLQGFFFADSVAPPRSILSGARKLPPGHWLRWKGGRVFPPEPFWNLRWSEGGREAGASEAALVRELGERLDSAVDRQLVSDVPVGVLLSGGLDSSMVVALASKRRAVPTFSISFESPDLDESRYVRRVVERFRTEHFEERLGERELLDALDGSLDALDEPLGDPSIVPTFVLARMASRHVKVALGGDGGDELWAGYPTYRAHRLARYYRWIPGLVKRRIIEPVISALPVSPRYQSLEWKAKRFALRWDDNPYRRHLRWMSATDLRSLSELFPSLRSEPDVLAWGGRHAGTFDLNQILALDFETYLPNSVLVKVDRASMANGLEVRPPFLDNDLVAWAFSLTADWKLRGRVGKYLLKRYAAGLLPEEVLRRPKQGFAIPLSRWLLGSLQQRVRLVLRESPVWELPVIDRAPALRWMQEHESGQEDRSKPLWSLLVLDHWMRRAQIAA